MKNPKPLLRVSVIGTVLVALCCFTPILVILLALWLELRSDTDVEYDESDDND